MDKNNRKLKILYKCIKANTSAIWQHMLHIPPTKAYSSPNRSNKQKDKSHTKEPAYLSENGGLRKKRSGEWAKSRKG